MVVEQILVRMQMVIRIVGGEGLFLVYSGTVFQCLIVAGKNELE
jgi:hypothetical protein